MRALLGLVALVACSSPNEDDILILDGSVIRPDATIDGGFDDDASADAEAGPVFNGGGPFICGDCVCDGTLHVCASGVDAGGGGAPIVDAGDGGGGACPEQDAGSGCVDIPIDCLPKPTCECVAAHYQNCLCVIVGDGNGIGIACPSP